MYNIIYTRDIYVQIYVQYLVRVNCEALGCVVGDHPPLELPVLNQT